LDGSNSLVDTSVNNGINAEYVYQPNQLVNNEAKSPNLVSSLIEQRHFGINQQTQQLLHAENDCFQPHTNGYVQGQKKRLSFSTQVIFFNDFDHIFKF
jgi:hypothetical protein